MPARVALLDLPPIMSEIVLNILEETGDIVVVEASERERADVVILTTDRDDLPSAGRMQLARRPGSKVLTINELGQTAYLYELRPHKTPLGELSAEVLLTAIRTGSAGWE